MVKDKSAYIIQGDNVRQARKHAGLSRSTLADRIHCGKSLIASIEQGKRNLTLENAKLIAKECNVKEGFLLGISPYMTDEEAIKDTVGKLQKLDVMWVEFLKYVSLLSGYEMKECDNAYQPENETMIINTSDPYLKFIDDSGANDFTIRDTNIYMEDITRYAELRLKMMIERKQKEG